MGDDRLTTTINELYRTESRRVLATLIRLLGDFDIAEEALHDAFVAAVEQWPRNGVPANPRAWLVSAGRFKAVDAIRRRARHDAKLAVIARDLDTVTLDRYENDQPGQAGQDSVVGDDRLRLIFICCHPALPPDNQIALTLREVCGLTTEEIAAAFLITPATLAKRIVRAKATIREEGIPYEIPDAAELPGRLDAVLRIAYLVFNEGYAASSGASLTRADLSAEAIRLARLIVELMPRPEATALLALMLLQDSRREARTSPSGELLLLDEQDRVLWNREQIAEGIELAENAMSQGNAGYYALQAAIAALHAEAESFAATDWEQIAALYDVLLSNFPSPVVELNRAVAVAMIRGPVSGLELVDAIMTRGDLHDYHLAYSVQADFYKKLGRNADAKTAYERALALTQQETERRFILRRIAALSS